VVVDMDNIVILLNGVVMEMVEQGVVVVLIIKTIQTIAKLVIQTGQLRIIVAEIITGVIVTILIMFQVQTVYFVLTAVPVAPRQHIVLAVTQLSLTICRQLIYVVALPINSLIPLINVKIVVPIATLVLQVLVHALHASHLSLYQMAHVSVQPILSFNILLLTEFGHTNAHR